MRIVLLTHCCFFLCTFNLFLRFFIIKCWWLENNQQWEKLFEIQKYTIINNLWGGILELWLVQSSHNFKEEDKRTNVCVINKDRRGEKRTKRDARNRNDLNKIEWLKMYAIFVLKVAVELKWHSCWHKRTCLYKYVISVANYPYVINIDYRWKNSCAYQNHTGGKNVTNELFFSLHYQNSKSEIQSW